MDGVRQGHISDHLAQLFHFPIVAKRKLHIEYIQKRVYKDDKIQSFLKTVNKIDWDEIYNFPAEDVNCMWNLFSERFNELFNNIFPLKRVIKQSRKAHKQSYLTPEIESIRKHLDVLFTMSKNNSSYSKMYKHTK